MLQHVTNLLRIVTKCYNLKNTKRNHIRTFSPNKMLESENYKKKSHTNFLPKIRTRSGKFKQTPNQNRCHFGFSQQPNKQKSKSSHDERASATLNTFSGSTRSTTAASLELSSTNLRPHRFDLERQCNLSWVARRRGFEPSSSIDPIQRRRRRRRRRRREGEEELRLRRERDEGAFFILAEEEGGAIWSLQ